MKFNNFYTPNNLSTIGGEFQSLTGLYPDNSILTKLRSGKNYFPYGLANKFKEYNYNTYAYHNNSYTSGGNTILYYGPIPGSIFQIPDTEYYDSQETARILIEGTSSPVGEYQPGTSKWTGGTPATIPLGKPAVVSTDGTTEPMVPVTIITSRNRRSSLWPARTIILLLIILARPVWKIPPPTINRPTIIITVEFANPASPSAGVRIWHISRASSEHIATISDLTFPLTNNPAAINRIINVAITSLLAFKRALSECPDYYCSDFSAFSAESRCQRGR